MSRAFTKEIDDAPPPPLPERPVSLAPNKVTRRGAALIRAELERIDAAIAAAPHPSAELLRDQRYWAARQATMQVIALSAAPERVGFGTSVEIVRRGRRRTIAIVGEDEADPGAGLLAWTSPLAQALDGAEPGEIVGFTAGGQDEDITVISVAALPA